MPKPESPRGDIPGSVLDSLLEGCQVIDPDYRYLYLNEAVVRHGRGSRDAMLGRTMMEVYPGIERTPMFATLRQCMEQRTHATLENEFTFPDGSSGWFELRFEPVPQGLAILSVEITDRKLAEAALHRTMRALTTLSQTNQALVRARAESELLAEICGIIVESAGYRAAWIGLFTNGDDAALRLSANAETPGTEPVLDVVASATVLDMAISVGRSGNPHVEYFDNEPRQSDAWRRAMSAAGIRSMILLPVRASDDRIGVLAIQSADHQAFDERESELLDEVALDLGFGIATLRARRDQARAMIELGEERARTRAIYDHLPHAAFVWRRTGGTFALADYNDAASAATGGGSTLVGAGPAAFEDLSSLAGDLDQCFTTREPVRREVDCLLPGAGRRRRFLLTYGYIPLDMVLLHAEDVTERRQTEEQLAASQRIEAIGRLAGGVAHDFNNLLSVILSHVEFAVQQLDERDPVRADVEEIGAAGRRAADLTRQLLAFSRKQVLRPQPLDLNDVVNGMEGMLRRLLGEDIEIAVQSAENLGTVMADPGQLDQVIMNLAVNARHAMPHGGRLTIETANRTLDRETIGGRVYVEPGRYVLLSVTDTGHGMDAATQTRIFEPFFTTRETGEGTGLGLSTVYGIVKQSGGSIEVYSEPGTGTCFRIYLPRIDASPVVPTDTPSETACTGTETILVVEDEEAVRRAIVRILEAVGYTVMVASNGPEALHLCENHEGPLHLLLTDVVMPRMNGRELADRLLALRPDVRVLFTSGYADSAIVNHEMLASGTPFIGKPFTAADLTCKVRDVLDA